MQRPLREASKARRKKVIILMASQMAKTTGLMNLCGHRLCDDPTPILFIEPTKSLVDNLVEKPFMQMVRSSQRLGQLYGGGKQSTKHIKLVAGVKLRLAWAGSASELAGDPAGMVIIDERDRMPEDVGGEGSVDELADTRLSNYPDGVLVETSTPTIGNVGTYVHPDTGVEHWAKAEPEDVTSPIWRLFQEGTMHEWAWPCPHCREYFIPRFRHLKWPKDSTPQQALKRAHLECPHCDLPILDGCKTDMNEAGTYIAPGQRVTIDGIVEGAEPDNDCFSSWASGLCSPWQSFGQRAQKFLAAVRSGDPARVQAVINTRFGELYAKVGDAPDWQHVTELARAGHRLGDVPAETLLLLMTVDVQKDRVFYVIRAWLERHTSYLVERGEIIGPTDQDEIWQELDTYRARRFGEQGMTIRGLMIDSGYRPGDKFKRPDNQIYDFGRRNAGWVFVSKGHAQQERPIRASLIDITLRGKTYKQGLTLWHLDTDHYKTWVHGRLQWPADKPGGWYLPEDIDEDYCRQIVAEGRVVKPSGHAVWVRVRKANHYLDCEMQQAALADHFKVASMRYMPPEKPSSDGTHGLNNIQKLALRLNRG